jgi:Tol biopolymer transport system component
VFVHDRQTGQTARVSVASSGAEGEGASWNAAISADGRYVAFESDARNLVTGDTNGREDVFVRDRQTAQTTRVSVSSTGAQGTGHSVWPAISADGRYVAFESDARNLVAGDSNNLRDVFVRDRQAGQTTRVSVASDGTQGDDFSSYAAISADGRYVAFYSGASTLVAGDTNGAWDVFLRDRQAGQTTRVSVASDGAQANSNSYIAAISADGRCVAFFSDASNLVAGDTNWCRDVFVRDRGPSCAISYSPSSPTTDDIITFDSGAADDDGAVVSREWTFGDGGAASGDPVAHQYAMPGSYAVTVTVCDDDGYCTECTTDIAVAKGANIPPICDVTYEPLDPETGQDITFNANAYDPNPWGEIVSCDWDFGDGGGSMLDPAVHTYACAGDYAVCVTVTDDQGGQTTCCTQLHVAAACDCDVAIDRTHCQMPAAGHVGQCKTGQIGARNRSLTESCDVVLRVADNAGNVVFETMQTIAPGRRLRVRFDHCYTADETGRRLWTWEVWPMGCRELTPWDNVHQRRVNVHP